MGNLKFYHIEACYLCNRKGIIETDQTDYHGDPEFVECPCCHGAGELRIYGNHTRPNN